MVPKARKFDEFIGVIEFIEFVECTEFIENRDSVEMHSKSK